MRTRPLAGDFTQEVAPVYQHRGGRVLTEPTMSTPQSTTRTPQEASGTDTFDAELTDRVTGPHTGYDQYGQPDYSYFHCQRCGAESTRRKDLRGCC